MLIEANTKPVRNPPFYLQNPGFMAETSYTLKSTQTDIEH